jgi:hypothetical protein
MWLLGRIEKLVRYDRLPVVSAGGKTTWSFASRMGRRFQMQCQLNYVLPPSACGRGGGIGASCHVVVVARAPAICRNASTCPPRPSCCVAAIDLRLSFFDEKKEKRRNTSDGNKEGRARLAAAHLPVLLHCHTGPTKPRLPPAQEENKPETKPHARPRTQTLPLTARRIGGGGSLRRCFGTSTTPT